MPECPVCRTNYVKGRLARCHVCGWQFEATGFSMIGPVKIEHRISGVTLSRIQAWAHHMWSTIQQQKERIVQLQGQLRQLQSQAPAVESLPPPPTPTAKPSPEEQNATAAEMWQWVLSRLEQAEQEREHLKSQIAQLQGQSPMPVPAPALQGNGMKQDLSVELIKWREESQAFSYKQSEQWQAIFEHFRYNTQQAIAQQEQTVQLAIAPLEQQVQSQQAALEQLKTQWPSDPDAVGAASESLRAQLQELRQSQAALSEQMEQELRLFQQAQTEQLQATLAPLSEQLHAQQQFLADGMAQQQPVSPSSRLDEASPALELDAIAESTAQSTIAALEVRLHSLAQSQDQATAQLADQIKQLQQSQNRALRGGESPEMQTALEHLQAQLQQLQTAQEQSPAAIPSASSEPLPEPASLAWQRQKNEILTKISRFDRICEQFQRLESAVAQLQKTIHTPNPPSALPSRHTNTVYTRYQ
ncbi:MAG: hypothetical protein ACPGVO_17435 [Spirulinaceae cyanobacterium]